MDMKNPPHPGELIGDTLDELDVSVTAAAEGLGITIIGGLVLSQILTLYTTPVVYLYLDRFRHWSMRRRQNPASEMRS